MTRQNSFTGTVTPSDKTNPFQWYVGKTVSLRGRAYVVEDFEVQGRNLSFLLRDRSNDEVRRIDPVDLVSAPLLD